jgi:rhodanese-related sulfurtransferase
LISATKPDLLGSRRNRNKTRTAAIAASVISVFLLAGLLFLVLWLKKRRRRILHDKLPEPYTKDREGGTPSSPNGMVRPNLLPTVQKPSAGSSSALQSMPVEPQSAAPLTDIRDRADDADRHHPRSTRIPGPDILAAEEKSRDAPSAGASSESNFTPVDQQPESAVVSGSMTDDDTPREETLALRLRVQRMEAQLQAILTMGMAEGAPPSYTG